MVNYPTTHARSNPLHHYQVADLKAKAEKAKDVSITKVTNTRDRYSSTPSSKSNWDPNWKRAPPSSGRTSTPTSTSTTGPPLPPLRSRPDSTGGPPVALRASRPTDDMISPPPYSPPPPPTRPASGYPPSHRDTPRDTIDRIDWTNLSAEDKEEFFGWLDEFFSRYLGIELGPRKQGPGPLAVSVTAPVNGRSAPTVNMATRPQV